MFYNFLYYITHVCLQMSRWFLVCILFFRCHSPTNMALGFVHIQHLSCLVGQRRIDLLQALSHILMYGCGYLERFLLRPFFSLYSWF